MTRKNLTLLHVSLASFFLPVGLMFLLTGALYTAEIKGSYETTTVEVALDAPLSPDGEQLRSLVANELATRGIDPPSGGSKVRKVGSCFQFEWTGSSRDIVLRPTEDPAVAQLDIKETNWHRRFVQLHKAKGGDAFQTYAIVWSSGLFLLFASGFGLGMMSPPYRPVALGGLALGVVVFLVLVALG